jgi:hypothetical protein
MKNKTIRKRQIYKNINKNKTKYITGGALSDYFAEIKKGLNAKCISETDVNNVNYMKKQLSELNYKINKMENKNNNECSDTCMREIMRLKYEINKILIFLTSLNLKNILNKNYTIEPDVLAKKSQISTYTNLLTDFLFSENKPEKSVQLEPAKKQNDAVRIASKTAIQTIQSQAHERARQLDAKIKKKPTPIARATDPSPVALAPIAVPLASPIASPVAPRVESPIASPVAPRVESPLASPVETQVSSPQVASPIASIPVATIPVATIPVATIPLAPQVVSPTRETTQVAEREARQVASPARETTQVAEREAAERETLERETAEREARQVASPARETTQLTSSLVSAATREAIQVASPASPRVESPLASPLETQVSSPQVAAPVATIPVATIPVAPTRETTQVAEREARQVASPARETTQLTSSLVSAATREAIQIASPASPRVESPLASPLETQVSSPQVAAPVATIPVAPRVESPLASQLETQISSPQVASLVASIPVAPRVESPLASLASPLASPASPLASPASPHASPALSLASPLASPASPASPRVESLPVAPQVVSPTRETTQVAEREARQVASPARETTQLTSSLVSASTREAIQIASPASPRVESPLASPLETQVSSPQVAAPVATIPVSPRVESPLASLASPLASPASQLASPASPHASPALSLASPLASPASPASPIASPLASPASPLASPASPLASPLASPAAPRVESLPVAPQVVSPTRETTQVAERETERERGIELDEISAKFDAESVISRVPSRVASPILASATREARKVEPAQVSQGSRATRLTSTPLSQGPRVAKLTPIAPAQVSQGSRATRLTSIASAPLSQGPRAERERGIELDEITANFDAESVASRVASPILASIPVATLPLARAVVSRAKRALLINELKAIQDYIPKITTQLPITIQNIYIFLKENETLATALENIDNIDLLKEKKYETLYAIVTNIITLQNNLKYLLHFKSKKKHGFIDTVDLTKLSVSISNLKYKYSKQNINIINYLDDTQKDNLIKVINTNENFWKRGGYNKTIKNKKRVKTYRKNKKNKKNKTIKPLFIYNSLI